MTASKKATSILLEAPDEFLVMLTTVLYLIAVIMRQTTRGIKYYVSGL
jgi:hypothetical protein